MATWVAIYGAFLIFAGLLGYMSNPAEAKTALISGGAFGSLNLIFAFGISKGFHPIRRVTIAVAAVLSVIFCWRASVSWLAVLDGEPKLIAAILITSMLAASILIIIRLLRR